MKYLNLGCGTRFHNAWTNVDFVSTGEGVIAHNLLNGIPLPDNQFDAVYHSHVLEHFPKDRAPAFIRECYRVLKPGGVIRVAVPDLEQIAREYIKNLEGALAGDQMAAHNYDWIMIELYDQTVRHVSGGAYGPYFSQEVIPNEEYLIGRMGYEYRNTRKAILEHKKATAARLPAEPAPAAVETPAPKGAQKPRSSMRFLKPATYVNKLKSVVFRQEYQRLQGLRQQLKQKEAEEKQYQELGRFRMSGEIHQWMYDRYSLRRLLENAGFREFAPTTAYESRIPGWLTYQLDTEQNSVRKPDSLFAEARKPE